MEQTSQWDKIKKLFEAALECEPSHREDFLNAACGPDEFLRREVHSLLSAYAQSDGLSEYAWPKEIVREPKALTAIGPYRLIEKIGEGGMGQVWLAEQSAPLQRQVALKLVRPGIYHDSLLRRFEAERQSLALMDHPSIAKVFDAGTSSDGRPYFVMEYVPGEPITNYCDHKKLNIRERLQLFIKACDGVQHAHQKAIIHRDLKPANILVVETDGKPMPRIIDFGLAKAANPLVAGQTLFTHAGGFVGTPGYMSPEQADSTAADIDTRTDVYSLGVILYELLTGFLPFDPKQWQKMPFDEVLRQLREQDPPRPSNKVEAGKEASKTFAELRATEPKPLASALRGDLDWITLKAIEKDRRRRYGTPSELAADVGRYLQNEAILARPASPVYRVQKYVRRHRVFVSVGAGLLFLLAGFAGVQARQLRRITSERDRANRITEFMTGMFKVADPSQARGNTIVVREILDKASRDIDTGLTKDPELQSQMMRVMGKVYDNLGLYPRADSLFQRAIAIERPLLGSENSVTLASLSDVGWTLMHEGQFAAAEKILRDALGGQRRTLGPKHPDTLKTMNSLAWTLTQEGHYREAESLFRETIALQRRVLGPEHPETLQSMNNLGMLLNMQGRHSEAEQLCRETLEIRRRVLGPEHPETLQSMNNLAGILAYLGKYSESEALCRETLDIRRRVLGPEHPETIRTMSLLAISLKRQHRFVEAEKLGRETLAIQQRLLGAEHPSTLLEMNNLAVTLNNMGKYAEAERIYMQALRIDKRVLGPEAPLTATAVYNLACIAAVRGQRDKALSMLTEAVEHGLPAWTEIQIEQDPDLRSLHDDPRFAILVNHARASAAAQTSN